MRSHNDDRRSQRTRKLLSEALIALITEQSYNAITVQDIIDRANVGRSTFYAHYQDKDDLLMSSFAELIGALEQHLAQDSAHTDEIFPSLALFQHVKAHHFLYKALLWGQGISLIYKAGQTYVTQAVERRMMALYPNWQQATLPLPVLATYVSGVLLTLIQWWLDSNMSVPPEQMDEMFRQLVMPSLQAALPAK